ncbi:unnamed protein product [Staurois parvus]|uniref:Uncharacterized protein n=1 Tax=Staurois parvus TaxID=386267 RepID=A0ABN9EKY8_9NEOB|nr:unnamed protein product [Staurois parvus]
MRVIMRLYHLSNLGMGWVRLIFPVTSSPSSELSVRVPLLSIGSYSEPDSVRESSPSLSPDMLRIL